MASKNGSKGISRIDSGSTHGWFVRSYRNGKTYSKLFSDRKCGSKEKAYELATEYRADMDDKLKEIAQEPRKKRVVSSDSRNKTGELGVTYTVRKGPKGQKYESYSVSWRPVPRVQKCTSFSIKKYGKEEALKLAIEHRRKVMREIHGDVKSGQELPPLQSPPEPNDDNNPFQI